MGTGQMGLVTLPFVGGIGTGQMGLATATLPLVGGMGTGQMGLVTLPFVGGMGTGQMGLATATLPLVGGIGTGQMGLATATLPLVGGMGTGQIGLVTFPPGCENTAGAVGLATAKVTEAVRIRTRRARRDLDRKFSMEEVILIVLLCVNDRSQKSTPYRAIRLQQK
jgi:hypothetical protein